MSLAGFFVDAGLIPQCIQVQPGKLTILHQQHRRGTRKPLVVHGKGHGRRIERLAHLDEMAGGILDHAAVERAAALECLLQIRGVVVALGLVVDDARAEFIQLRVE